ncbi:MAG: hypothetical protein V4565_11660 [Bacteroidota bacterium]
MKQSKLLFFLCLYFISTLTFKAQVPIVEKTYEISKGARKGNLKGVVVNQEKETFDMVYMYNTGKRGTIGQEIYSYDKDLNLVDTRKEETPVEKIKYEFYSGWKGETYTTNFLSASYAFNGIQPGLVFRKKQINAWYNDCLDHYEQQIKVLESVKPKTDEGNKYGYTAGIELKRDSCVLVLACRPEKKTLNAYRFFDVLKCDNNVNITVTESIELPYANQAIFSQQLEDDETDIISNEDQPRDWIIVFAPMETGKYFIQYQDKPTNFTYLRITAKGKLVEKVNFSSPSNGWRITGAYEKDGSVFLYGPSITKKPEEKFFGEVVKGSNVPTTTTSAEDKKAMAEAARGSSIPGMGMVNTFNGASEYGSDQEQLDVALDLLKYTNYQVAKISNSKLDFVSSPNIEAFEEKQMKPEGQKKFVKFDGKKFIITGISFTKSGDIFINGQDFTLKEDRNVYGGIYMFRFDKAGTFLNNYGIYIDRDDKDARYIPTRVQLYDSGDEKSLYFFLKSAQRFKTEKEKNDMASCIIPISFKTKTRKEIPLFQFEYGSINLGDGKMSAIKTFGEGERKELYLMKNVGIYKMNNSRIFFSETKKKDKILITKVDLSK